MSKFNITDTLIQFCLQLLTETSHQRFFHLTPPTQPAKPRTSSRSNNLSTVNHSLANSSLLAQLCTKLWQARHNQATSLSRSSVCHPLFSTLACTLRGIRWWYVSGICSLEQISHSVASSFVWLGGGGGAMSVATKLVKIGVRNSASVCAGRRYAYVDSDSSMLGGSGARIEEAVCLASGSVYLFCSALELNQAE